MKLEAENRELLFARDCAVSAFQRAKAVYMADLRNDADPAKEPVKPALLRVHFDAMADAADKSSAAEEALAAYNKAHEKPADAPAAPPAKLAAVPPPASA